jgi:hypothetical protein
MALAGHLFPAVSDDLLIAPVPMPARLRLKCCISHPLSNDCYARFHGKVTFPAATSRR